VDAVWVVDCLESTQIERVMARSGWTREAVQRVMAQQSRREHRLAAADATLFNEGLSLEQLQAQVVQVWQHFGLSS
jgi:dephospho-CoA kinase